MVSNSGESKQFNLKQLLRDDRFWKIAFQIITLAVVIAILGYLLLNLSTNLSKQGIDFGFGFLSNPAGFSIGESAIEYLPNDPYGRALFVGFVNTITLVIAGIILATTAGVAAGVASFSQNWLVHKISRAYVGLTRNIPLLLQLFFWYFAVYGVLPTPQEQLNLGGLVIASKRGVYVPWPASSGFLMWLGILVALAIAAFFVWQWRTKSMVEQGDSGQTQLMILGAIALAGLVIFAFMLGWEAPTVQEGGGATGGLRLSREYVASLTALVFYTGAFIAEIVRAGIQSVSKGQWEAARSLGLPSNLSMRLVVFPQALRVIIPPLNSEFMNLAKNSSLAFAVAYPELYSIANTTFNQTGRPIEVFLVLMATYLTINLIITLGMNTLNQTVQFKER
ncbi:ABC transporter permease subunit [Oscillatoria sp. CS-180]|uniref:amino acid ABC transporter permease n=1 Tax=Oscillatoria sp. CS-180 TaxID=3021720 RepID=UPI00232F1AE4|nr:ABC transporter permease subunit [Oscillatoria sp. CS-180]MDB9524466.1 ABC transporter permease subunit [Oscillatoria sp. CS-180]